MYKDVHKDVYMRTNIDLNDDLVAEAFKYSDGIFSKRELVETALLEYVENRKRKNLQELKGRIRFRDDYDYKSMSAAYLYFLCRRSGITVRSTVDILIAETAIENEIPLFQNDSVFLNMAKAITALRFY